MRKRNICVIPDCGKFVHSYGLCGMHNMRLRRYGSPDVIKHFPKGAAEAFLVSTLSMDTDECIPWPFTRGTNGYGIVSTPQFSTTASREACFRKHGAPPSPKHEAAHSCGNGHNGCVNWKHLRWATTVENMADKRIHGTHGIGTLHSQAKLTEQQVLEIRRLCSEGAVQRHIVQQFGVAGSTVYGITKRKIWKHI